MSISNILVFGATGWIGQQMIKLLDNYTVYNATSRLENCVDCINEIDKINPSHVLLTAGLTGRPNIDWCEDNKEKVMGVNVVGTINIVYYCFKKGIHVTYVGTGCIYEYDDKHKVEGEGFREEEEPNFWGSYYSKTKIMVEKVLKEFNNVLILRIRMPLSDDLHPRSFITKIVKYEKVVNVPNSMSVLSELVPIAVDMMVKSRVGVYNFVNPGVISHNEILELYKKYIDKDFRWVNFTLEEQSKILKSGRSNNRLNVDKLLMLYPNINDIKMAVEKLFQRMEKLMCLKD